MSLELTILAAALVLLAGVAAVRVSARAGVPSLLLYLAIGLAIGEGGLGIEFEDADLTVVLSSIALAMILAEGGFGTKWSVIRPVVGLAGLLATLGVLVSVTVTAGLTWLLLDVDVRTAILLGAVVGSTDAAATFSVMRRLPVRPRTRATVEAESGFNDPPVIVLVTVVASDAWGATSWPTIAGLIGYQLAAGVALGLAAARAGQWVLSRSALPAAGLYPLATLAILFVAFACAGLVGASGIMAIYVAALWLGNARLPHRQATAGFTEGLGWLAQIGLFVLLGLLASPDRLPGALLPAAIVGLALTLVARPLSVLVCASWFRVPLRQQVFLSWAGLRGAVPIVLATIPVSQGLPSAERIFDVVFLLVVVFTLVQAPFLPWVARHTGVAVPFGPRELEVESAPLDEMDAALLQFRIPVGSRLHGVHVADLRLPARVALALVHRDGEILVPDRFLTLRAGDHLLLAVPDEARDATEERLRAIGRAGRLAVWHATEHGHRRPRPPASAGAADDDHGAMGVPHDLLRDRAQHQRGETTAPSAGDDQHVR